MNVSPDFAWLTVALSLTALGLLSWHLPRTVRGYQLHHDDRAAVSLAVAVSATVMALGLLISAVGLLLNEPDFSLTGLGIARAAMLSLAAVLVFADVRHAP
jgi:predicted MFS family arabinose efflux permease